MTVPRDWLVELPSILRRDLGLRWTPTHETSLRAFVSARMVALGLSTETEYIEYLDLNDAERRRLWRQVRVGETYFLREEPALRCAIDLAREIYASRGTPVSIWSAGCSTGEEPYTLAMLAREARVPVSIVATDVDERALQHAERGLYGIWSLRKLSPKQRESYFDLVCDIPSEFSGVIRPHFQIEQSLGSAIHWRSHNLVSARPPQAPVADGWDLVFCRNTLLYFEPEVANEVMLGLVASLAPEGHLVLGMAESARWVATAAIRRHGPVLTYQRDVQPTTATAVGWWSTAEDEDARAGRGEQIPFPSGNGTLSAGAEERESVKLDPQRFDTLLRARIWEAAAALTAGEPQRAQAILEALSSAHQNSAEVQYLLAIAARGQGNMTKAEKRLRGAHLLDPTFWPSTFLLALRLHETGKYQQAQTMFRATLDHLPSRGISPVPLKWPSLRPFLPPVADIESECRRRLQSDPSS